MESEYIARPVMGFRHGLLADAPSVQAAHRGVTSESASAGHSFLTSGSTRSANRPSALMTCACGIPG